MDKSVSNEDGEGAVDGGGVPRRKSKSNALLALCKVDIVLVVVEPMEEDVPGTAGPAS